jgi:hypothetical protein
VVGAIVVLPFLVLGSCALLLGGAAKSFDDSRAGGAVNVGDSYTYASGVAVSASVPQQVKVDNQFIVDPKKENAFETKVTLTNGTDHPESTALLSINMTAGGKPAERVFDDATPLTTQDLQPGQKAEVPARFKVAKGTTGAIQISVAPGIEQPTFFAGQLK